VKPVIDHLAPEAAPFTAVDTSLQGVGGGVGAGVGIGVGDGVGCGCGVATDDPTAALITVWNSASLTMPPDGTPHIIYTTR